MPDDGTKSKQKSAPHLDPKESLQPQSFYQGLKTEWSLFWDNIIEDEDPESEEDIDGVVQGKIKDPFVTGKIEKLSLFQLKEITKALSGDRKALNQKLESINKELELNTAKLESLKLVGGDYSDTESRIHELTNLGHEYSEKLNLIDERLKKSRTLEKSLKQS